MYKTYSIQSSGSVGFGTGWKVDFNHAMSSSLDVMMGKERRLCFGKEWQKSEIVRQ